MVSTLSLLGYFLHVFSCFVVSHASSNRITLNSRRYQCWQLLYESDGSVAAYDIRVKYGFTALIRAAVNGHTDCARILVQAGAAIETLSENVRDIFAVLSSLFLIICISIHSRISQGWFTLPVYLRHPVPPSVN